jgi:hypothetical protein
MATRKSGGNKAPVNPFAAARVTTTAAATSKSPIYIADAVLDPTGRELFTKPQVVTAYEKYVEGHGQVEQGKSLMDANRPICLSFARIRFAQEYVMTGKMPDNPKVMTSNTGGGATATIVFQDRCVNMNDSEKERLAEYVGADNIDSCVGTKDIFTLNPDALEMEVEVRGPDGKPNRDTVMNHMAAALQEKFKDHSQLLASLFTLKPCQQTVKGLVERAVDLVGKGDRSAQTIDRVAQFLEAAKVTTQIKPVGAA